MANIASAFLNINFPHVDASKIELVEEIVSAIKSSSEFNYGGDCDASYDEFGCTISVGFSCKWTGVDCWNWLNVKLASEIEDSAKDDISVAARKLLISAEINGYSYEYGCKYRDKIEKASGQSRLSLYQHKVSDYEWPQALDYIGAYDLEEGSSIGRGNEVEVCLIERDSSEEADFYLFQVDAQVGSMFILLNKLNDEVYMISCDELEGEERDGRIGDIVDLIEEESFDWDESEASSYSNEVLDDLLCDDDLYELIDGPNES